jgi:hypothetical protein
MGALAAASLASRPGLTFRSTASQRDTLASKLINKLPIVKCVFFFRCFENTSFNTRAAAHVIVNLYRRDREAPTQIATRAARAFHSRPTREAAKPADPFLSGPSVSVPTGRRPRPTQTPQCSQLSLAVR